MLVNNYPKQSPIIGVAGLGGGINSYIFLSSGSDYVISRSLRFNSGDSSHLNRTPSSAGNRKTWTWSGWVKRSTLGTGSGGRNVLFDSTVGWTGSGDTTYGLLNFSPDNQLGFGVASTGTYTTAIFRDTSAWYHVVAAMDTTQAAAADRLKLYVNGVQHTHSGYTFTQNTDYAINTATEHAIGMEERTDAAKFDGYLADIHFIDGQALAATDFGSTDDDGVWQPKKFSGAHGTNGFHLDFKDNSSNAALGYDAAGSNNWTVNNLIASSTPVDTVGATSGLIGSNIVVNRPGSYNFAHVSSNIASDPGDQAYVKVDFASLGLSAPATITFDSYQQGGGGWSLVPNTVYTDAGNTTSSFTYSSNTRSNTVSIPSGATYFAIPPSWTSAAGGILSNGINNLVWNGTAVSYSDGSSGDSLIDSPSQNVADETDTGVGGQITGNYATYNPVRVGSGTKSNGNLTVTGTGQVPDVTSIAPNSGKWYAEIKWDSGTYARIGLQDVNIATSDFGGVNGQSYRYESNSGNVQPGGQTYSTYAAGDIIGVAFDCDAGKLWLAKNGTWQNSGNPASGTGAVATNLVSGSYYAPASSSGSGSSVFTLNAGQRAFAYTAPTGFKSLNTANLTATIEDGSKYFDTKLFNANASTQSISLGFSPDFVWLKSRANAYGNEFYDIIRGVNKRLTSNTTAVEQSLANQLTSFDSNGFTLGDASSSNYNSGTASVGWAWDAGSSTVTNNDGSIASQVRANLTAGFSIATATMPASGDPTIGLGLNANPDMLIFKSRTSSEAWYISHKGLTNQSNRFLRFDTSAELTNNNWFNNTAPTSSVVTLKVGGGISANNDVVIYSFSAVEGYSSFGKYTGNGDADGVFIYTGFTPSWLLFKRSDSTSDWSIYDTARDPHNVAGDKLEPNTSDDESEQGAVIDILSNGFKFRRNSLENGGNDVYVYAAFASHPFKSARAR